jgi:DNA-binding CsgD family transcriptional regulator
LSAAAAAPGLADQLTARELDVLRLLAAGAPNPRIAEQLVVSLDTVKKHVSHLLGKLGAGNRTEAVTRARELGLIPSPRTAAHPGGTIVPRGRARRHCHTPGGWGRFHRHMHRRVTPDSGASSYCPSKNPAMTTAGLLLNRAGT